MFGIHVKYLNTAERGIFVHITAAFPFICFAVKVLRYIPEQCSLLSFNILLHVAVAIYNMISIKIFISL